MSTRHFTAAKRTESGQSSGTRSPAPGIAHLSGGSLPGGDEILTKEGLAEKMKVSVATIENWTRREHLPVIQKLNVVRYYWPDVLDHIRTNFKPCPRGTARPPLSK
jgi:hypothetical protein